MAQELILPPHVARFRRERWLTPAGETIVAPLPAGEVEGAQEPIDRPGAAFGRLAGIYADRRTKRPSN